ncbi:MAG: hypothetical protein NZ874_08690 [Fimbriimonadales bacterium]|nr:hypothetical protein [Fimbriimonadales bacterium]
MEQRTLWSRMMAIDRRILYLILAVNIVGALMARVVLEPNIPPAVRSFYETIEALQPGDIVMVSSTWSAGTLAENQPQFEAVLRHLMRKRLRFTIISFTPPARDISHRLARRLTREQGYVEGKDWAHFGYTPDIVLAVKGMSEDIAQAVRQDVRRVPIQQLEVMRGIKSLKDYKLVVDITPSDTLTAWISFRPRDLKIIYCPTSVMAAEAYTFLDSKQILGMITGAKGAYEYEHLLGIVGLGTRFINAIQFSHVLIITFILLGNFAMFMQRRSRS